MRCCGSKAYSDYSHFLDSNPTEYDQLLDDLTINVTQFFRDPIVFSAMEEEVLPLLIYDKVKHGKGNITIWSAGCSSGEEPYSIAIMLRELLARRGTILTSTSSAPTSTTPAWRPRPSVNTSPAR